MPLLVQVSTHYRPITGGQQVYISNLSKVLADVGWETKVIQPYRGERAPDAAVVPRLPWVARIIPSFDEFQFVVLGALIHARLLDKADVILCHYAATASIIGRVPRWRKKTIILSHGVEWNVDRMNKYDRVRENNARKLFGCLDTVANDTDYLRRMGMDVPAGQGFFSEIKSKIWFVPNCVDVDRFCPATIKDGESKCLVILVPRQISEVRGIHLSIEAFAELSTRRPDAVLHIVGPVNNQSYYEFCKSLVEKYKLTDRVFFKPPVQNDAMVEVYRAADVTLIPTLRQEGTSLSALESMACGTPVVLTDVAGLKDIPGIHCLPEAVALAIGIEETLVRRDVESIRQRAAVLEGFCFEKWSQVWVDILNTCVVSKSC